MTNQDLEVHATDISINVGIMGFREMIWGYGNKEETCYRICIGSFLSEDTCIDRRAMSNERICNLLKVISDSSKFEILLPNFSRELLLPGNCQGNGIIHSNRISSHGFADGCWFCSSQKG